MFKKMLLTSLLLFTFFGSISLGDCPTKTITAYSQGGCDNYTKGSESRYCNAERGFEIREEHGGKGNHTRTIQKTNFNQYLTSIDKNYTFTNAKDICEIQGIIGAGQDGMLGNKTIQKFLDFNFCQNLPPKEGEEGRRYDDYDGCQRRPKHTLDNTEITPAKPNPTPQQTPKCGEHAYTCASGENPSNQKYNEKEKTCTRNCGETQCPEDGKAVKCSTYSEAEQQLGIGLNKDCLVHGGCSLDVYKTLGIRQNSKKETRTSVLSFFQDIIGASTFFIGTILTIAFVISGFRYVLAGASGNDPQNAKNGMKYSIIGFVLVMSAYAIIRFVQYLASTGG